MMPQEVEAQGEKLIQFHDSWKKATKEQRRDMLVLMFRAIFVDVNNGAIQSFEPYPEFEILFMQTGMLEREGRFYLPDR